MFLGKALHTVDAKGRVFIPAKYRADAGSVLIICRGPDGCIRGYTPDVWKKVAEAYSATGVKMLKARRRLFASAEQIELDTQGRVLLPEELREMSGITDKVRIVGMADWMEFWDPERYEQSILLDGDDEMDLLAEEGLC